MKKMIIGLAVLSSASAFADCNKDTAECYLGTYEGYYNYYGDLPSEKCQVEISKKHSNKDEIQYNYSSDLVQFSGKVSSKTQVFANYTELYSDGSFRPVEYISRIRVKNDLPEKSKKKSHTLDLQLNENLELVGFNAEQVKYRPSLNVIFGIHDSWLHNHVICTKLVKVK